MEDREVFLVQLDHWKNECRICAEHHGFSCEEGCPHQERCEQVHKQIVALIKSRANEEKRS